MIKSICLPDNLARMTHIIYTKIKDKMMNSTPHNIDLFPMKITKSTTTISICILNAGPYPPQSQPPTLSPAAPAPHPQCPPA